MNELVGLLSELKLCSDRRVKFQRIASRLAGEEFAVPDELAEWLERDAGPIVTEMASPCIAIAALAFALSASRPTAQSFVGSREQILPIIGQICERAPRFTYESLAHGDDVVCLLCLEADATHEFWFAHEMVELPGPVWRLQSEFKDE